ncbi:MAG: rRNA pseudouridine synthase [Bdellovibrionaceae bacterium]|nr:rRNA pseudouridine synthase [Pseudobdellovibrionaceae bacterium]
MGKSQAKKLESELIRLNKYLADCGIASRRKADQLIAEGKVVINGKKVYELGTRVDPTADKILVDGKPVKPATNKVYIMFHKPKNVVTTMEDPEGRPTIADYFNRLPVRVFPVGRLDWDTEGLLLLTNDGEFAQRIMHPAEEVPKTYLAKISGHASDDALIRLRRGVSIPGGRVQALHVERIRRGADKYDWIKIVVGEGKNRQVRRMFEKIGFDVLKLQRVAIGRLRIGTLERGEYVFLTEAGVQKIFQKEPMVQKNPRSDKAAPGHLEPRNRTSRRPKKSAGPKLRRELPRR